MNADWTAEQIEDFQKMFDNMLAGDTAARRKITFIPGDAAECNTPAAVFEVSLTVMLTPLVSLGHSIVRVG